MFLSGGHVLFANTGKEHDRTLEFVERVGREWCPITWVEWQLGGFLEVDGQRRQAATENRLPP